MNQTVSPSRSDRGAPGATAAPELDRDDRVRRLLKRAAYLPIFSVPNAARPNRPIMAPGAPGRMIGVEVNEELHRFDIGRPTATPDGRPVNRVGEPVADVHIRWMVMPDDFEAGPGREPPPTPLDPSRPQRFCMLDGQLSFRDRQASGFRAFGAGRTLPAPVGNGLQLRLGAVIDALEGFGRLRGLPATIVVNGYITPPNGLALNLMVRAMDPTSSLAARGSLAGPQLIPNPDPDSLFLALLGEPDPDRPTTLNLAPDGRVLGSNVHEVLRFVDLGFDLRGGSGMRARAAEGSVAGTVAATLRFNPLDPNPVSPIATGDSLFTLLGRTNRPVGTLRADMIEGRSFRTELPGAPGPVFRFGGFGPFQQGTGIFQGATGVMSLNAAISVFPRTLSNLYVLRVSDPDGRFRAACRDAW